MAKRLIDVCNKEIELKKRIKLEKEVILDKTKDIKEDFNINEHEVQKFLLIFHTLMKVVSSDEELGLPAIAVTDSILQIVLKISELLKTTSIHSNSQNFLRLF